jgi:MalK OB fold domain
MSSRTRGMTMAVAGAAAISLLAACSSGGSSSSAGGGTTSSPASSASPSVSVVAGGSCGSGATKILFWAWVPGMGRAVTEFNKTHPGICVTQEDVGAGDPQYVAITNALKAGSGAPDVAEIEFDELPSFEVTHQVVNLVPYGANVFVATFIGSPAMNLYETGLSADGSSGSRPAAVLGSQRLDLPAPVAARVAAYQGRKVIAGIRPEDLVVSSGPGLVTEARIVEVLGSEQHVYFWLDATPAGQAAAAVADEAAEESFLVGSAPNGMARIDPHTPVKPGGRVTFTVDPARLYFFDPDTGHAITG